MRRAEAALTLGKGHISAFSFTSPSLPLPPPLTLEGQLSDIA